MQKRIKEKGTMVCNNIIDQIVKRRRLQSYWFQMHFDILKKVLDDNLPVVEQNFAFLCFKRDNKKRYYLPDAQQNSDRPNLLVVQQTLIFIIMFYYIIILLYYFIIIMSYYIILLLSFYYFIILFLLYVY